MQGHFFLELHWNPWLIWSKYLQNKLKLNNFVKEFLHKGGLRCEILTSAKINVGDIIKVIK